MSLSKNETDVKNKKFKWEEKRRSELTYSRTRLRCWAQTSVSDILKLVTWVKTILQIVVGLLVTF